MPHWGLKMDVPNRLLFAVAGALDDDFHAGDAGRLLAIGRALGLLGRLAFDEPDFLLRVQASQEALTNRVGDVLAEALREAGDDPADPELLLTLAEALAAAHDPRYGRGR